MAGPQPCIGDGLVLGAGDVLETDPAEPLANVSGEIALQFDTDDFQVVGGELVRTFQGYDYVEGRATGFQVDWTESGLSGPQPGEREWLSSTVIDIQWTNNTPRAYWAQRRFSMRGVEMLTSRGSEVFATIGATHAVGAGTPSLSDPNLATSIPYGNSFRNMGLGYGSWYDFGASSGTYYGTQSALVRLLTLPKDAGLYEQITGAFEHVMPTLVSVPAGQTIRFKARPIGYMSNSSAGFAAALDTGLRPHVKLAEAQACLRVWPQEGG